MKRFGYISVFFMAISLMVACTVVQVDDYQANTPRLSLDEFFKGDLVAYGIVRDRSGKTIRTFEAVLKGSWTQQGSQGALDEEFWFDDGEHQVRQWRMVSDNRGGYIGTAGDVQGEAEISTSGNAARLAYRLVVPYKGDSIVVSMDDWMYLVTPNVAINETVMTKWGFEVGKVTLVIMKAGVVDDIAPLLGRYTQ